MNLQVQRKIYSVSEITSEIKQALDQLGIVWIRGEISNFKHHSSGHMYFSLKDDSAQLKCAFFRGSNRYLKFRPEGGMEVLARGRLSVYEPRGDYQIIIEYLEPVGLGSLQLAFEQLKEKLHKEGLFDESLKKRLPLLPQKIGIVTSPTGAAVRDMLRILERRNASLDVLLYPARVQGNGSAGEIAAGIRYFNSRADIDVIIVGRGGGSIEDLWSFNEETVARAIHASSIPVISAVGHEIDFTISDLAADMRAPTPSAAAEIVSGAREELKNRVHSLFNRSKHAMCLAIERRKSHLAKLARNRAFNIAPNKIYELQQRFDEAALRLNQAMLSFLGAERHRERLLQIRLSKIPLRRVVLRRREALEGKEQLLFSSIRALLRERRSNLEAGAGRLNALSPLAILERGYAICRSEEGAVLKDAGTVAVGDRVGVILGRGELGCRVERIDAEGGKS